MKRALLLFSVMVFASGAWASTLQTLPGRTQPLLTWDVPDAAAFVRYNDLWLVTSDTSPLTVTITPEDAKTLGITAQEVLQVRGGQGVRLVFHKQPKLDVLQKEKAFAFDITSRPAPVQTLLSFKRGPQDLHWTAPQAGKMLRAFSPTTKETYPLLTATKPAGLRQPELHAGVQFLPAVLGAVLVSQQGQLMDITGNAAQGFNLTLKTPEKSALPVQDRGTYSQDLAALRGLFPLSKTTRSSVAYALVQAQNAVVEARRVAAHFTTSLDHTSPTPTALPPLGTMPLKTEEVSAANPPHPVASVAEAEPLLHSPALAVSANTADSLAAVAQRYARRSFDAAQHEALMAFVGASTDEARQQAVFDWAGMMFSFGRYAEVIGLLQTLPQDPSTQLPLLTEARLIEAAASMMLGRVHSTEKILQAITINSPQLQLWQAVTKVERGDALEAVEQFKQNATGLSYYPPAVRQQLEVWGLTAAYGAEHYADIPPQVQAIIDRDGDNTLPMAILWGAKAQIKLGKAEAAREALLPLQTSTDPHVRVEATMAMTSLALDNGDMKIDDALAAFEEARFAWRGDKTERDLTFDLANLYLKNSHYLEALELFKYYTVVFPEAEHTAEATRLMTEVFNQLFTTDLAEQVLDPLTQLALYYEFRELTPPGPQGDAMMKRVVGKLADTSLYPRAIELLERLINFRLQGATEKAEAGLTLAALHYANRSFNEGLKALNMTVTTGILPTALYEKRLLLQGRLQQALGQSAEALHAIAPLKTKPADFLRATIAWAENDAPSVIQLLSPYFQTREAAQTWQTDDHVALMQLALAYALQRQPENLTRLYTHYTQEIGVLKLEGAFQFLRDLAGEKGASVTNPDLWQNLLQALGTVRNFEDFYDRFRALRFTGNPNTVANNTEGQ